MMRPLHFCFAILWTPTSPLMLQPSQHLVPNHGPFRISRRTIRTSFILPSRQDRHRVAAPQCNLYGGSQGIRCNRHASSSQLHLSSQSEYDEIGDTTKSRRRKAKGKGSATKSKPPKKPKPSKKEQQRTGRTSKQKSQAPHASTTMSTAVCIVPPDDAWDTIQQARHLARDTTFYKWPPAIRLFHPFAPKGEVPGLVGKLAEWIEEEMDPIDGNDGGRVIGDVDDEMIDYSEEDGIKYGVLDDEMILDGSSASDPASIPASYLSSFSVTLDSIQILPHWEVLDARIEALEERMPQQTLGSTMEERQYQKRKAEGLKLIQEEERQGLKRKKERDRKKMYKQMKEREMNGEDLEDIKREIMDGEADDDESDEEEKESKNDGKKKEGYNGPCVIYLSPNDESRVKLEALREKLRGELFGMYDPFSPSSSVTPYPEQLPRKSKQKTPSSDHEGPSDQFRPLLPIARFPTVASAVKVAKILQRTWDPLTFNVTDVQFVSRSEEADQVVPGHDDMSTSGVGFGNANNNNNGNMGKKTTSSQQYDHQPGSDMDIPEVRHRQKHNTLQNNKNQLALTSSGEVEDVSRRGVYGCDAMVMLWGEEPEEDIMEEEASLSMIMDDNDDDDEVMDGGNEDNNYEEGGMIALDANGEIDYNQVFATAEREYQRMQAHEDFSAASYVGDVPIFDSTQQKDLEAWLDEDDDEVDDEGATVVIGRAQFFMGAMREFIGMPASSAIDKKDRIMGGGISAVARRKGSVHRLSESWDAGDYGKKDADHRPWK